MSKSRLLMNRKKKKTQEKRGQKKNRSGRNPGRLLFVSGTVLILAAVFLLGSRIYQGVRTERYCVQILAELMPLIPEYAPGIEVQPGISGTGQEVLEAEGVSCAGILEIPCLDKRWPVAGAYEEESRLPRLLSDTEETGETGCLIIEDARKGMQFGEISPADAGARVWFTDIRGQSCEWIITAVTDGDPAVEPEAGLMLRTWNPAAGKTRVVICEKG